MPEFPWKDGKWAEFVASHNQAHVFHNLAWGDLLSSCYGYRPFASVVTGRDGTVAAGIPLMEVSSWLTGQRWVSLPFTDYCPPLYREEELLEELVGELVRLSSEQGIPRIEVRWPLPERDGVSSGEESVLHTLSLSSDPEEVYRRFKKTQTQQPIRKAQRDGVQVQRCESETEFFHTFYLLHLQTRRRLGVPVQPKRFFSRMWQDLLEKGLGFVLVAYRNQALLSSAVFLTYNGTVTYKYSASDPEHWKLRANNLVLWTAIEWACQKGYHTFDFGKTDLDNEGLRAFKRGWGAKEKPLRYSVIAQGQAARDPGRRPRAPRKRQRVQMLMETVIRRSPLIVCRVMGELFYKHFA